MSIVLDGTSGINTSGTLVATGSLTTSSSLTTGTGAIYNSIQSGTAQASTSGTAITFTGIPSWAKRITVNFYNVSTSGTSNEIIQIGGSAIETTNYLGSTQYSTNVANWSSGAIFGLAPAATSFVHGSVFLSLLDSTTNTWLFCGNVSYSSIASAQTIAGSKVLTTGALTQLRITTANGTDTFDSGSINIMYE
jgi:hypothetical protein